MNKLCFKSIYSGVRWYWFIKILNYNLILPKKDVLKKWINISFLQIWKFELASLPFWMSEYLNLDQHLDQHPDLDWQFRQVEQLGAALPTLKDKKNWSQITKLIKGLIQSKEQKSIPEMMKFSEKHKSKMIMQIKWLIDDYFFNVKIFTMK